jgi:alginate O-acetyltransferase complex protein AlgI
MLFNSYIFMLVFFPLVMAAWWLLAKWPQVRLAFLVVSSFVFYGWWHWEFTLLLMLSTVVDYCLGGWIHRSRTKRAKGILLSLSLISNLGMLGYFKYCGFFAESINGLLDTFRLGTPLHVPDIILPVGISFYTFQTLTYCIDLYKGEIKPAKSLMHFAAYVSMFPQLIAGPIVRFSDVELQLKELAQRPDWNEVSRGIWFFVIGMCQKILIADTVSKVATPLLADPASLQFVTAWSALLAYTVQLYFDFAGYSNMAIGLGLMMGFSFPQNFDSPYQAASIQSFWRRWHMTLSSFLRDYLYIPLGGNRYGKTLSYRNLLIVMLLGGFWHGAGWTFILWGLMHGCLLVGNGLWRDHVRIAIPKTIGVTLTFFSVMMGWLLFRSTDMQMATHWYAAIFGLRGIESDFGMHLIPGLGFAVTVASLLFCWFAPNTWNYRPRMSLGTAVILSILLVICILRFDAESPFLYFQF